MKMTPYAKRKERERRNKEQWSPRPNGNNQADEQQGPFYVLIIDPTDPTNTHDHSQHQTREEANAERDKWNDDKPYRERDDTRYAKVVS